MPDPPNLLMLGITLTTHSRRIRSQALCLYAQDSAAVMNHRSPDTSSAPSTHPVGRMLFQTTRHMISRPFTNWKLLRGWHDAPQIPLHLEQAARRVLAIPPEETLCVLYDDTLFATGENGFVLTPHRICWKAMGEASVSLLRTSLRTRDVYAKANRVFVGAGELPLTGWNEAMTASLAERLRQWIGQKYLARQAYRVSPPTRQHWTVDEALKGCNVVDTIQANACVSTNRFGACEKNSIGFRSGVDGDGGCCAGYVTFEKWNGRGDAYDSVRARMVGF